MTSRTEARSPTARQSLMTAIFSAVQVLRARLPISELDAAAALVGAGLALVDQATAVRILDDFQKGFAARASDPAARPH